MKKDYNILYLLALTLVRAQACSDAGKGINKLDLSGNPTNSKLISGRYASKEQQILKAIYMIRRLTSDIAGVRFEVVKDTDGIAKYLIYFTYYLKRKKRQISFHTNSDKIGRFCRKNPKVRWDHGDSRANCQELIAYFGF